MDDAPPDPVQRALAGAQRRSRGRPRPSRRRDRKDRPHGNYSGAHPDETDPQLVSALMDQFVADRGWERPVAEARVFSNWSDIVGADVAAHCSPAALRAGELRIAAQSTAWATQLRLLAGSLLARIVAEVGPQVVTKVVITGPVAPSWKHGPRSVPGARGPRDTYG